MAKRATVGGMLLLYAPALLFYVLASSKAIPRQAADQVVDEPAPPAGQTYLGSRVCSSCHFEQFGTWRKDKHAQAFEILPDKYKTDASCLECHTTGFGEETGFKAATDTHLAGTTCEACHGPGSKHREIVEGFNAASKLTAEQEKMARDSIYKVLPHNACIRCHASKAHQAHPDYDK